MACHTIYGMSKIVEVFSKDGKSAFVSDFNLELFLARNKGFSTAPEKKPEPKQAPKVKHINSAQKPKVKERSQSVEDGGSNSAD